jgi:peptide subunit release factor 1 (eRF1)
MSMVAAFRNNYEKERNLLLSLSLDSFKQLVWKQKSKVEVKNPIAYFTVVLNKKFQERYFEELRLMEELYSRKINGLLISIFLKLPIYRYKCLKPNNKWIHKEWRDEDEDTYYWWRCGRYECCDANGPEQLWT